MLLTAAVCLSFTSCLYLLPDLFQQFYPEGSFERKPSDYDDAMKVVEDHSQAFKDKVREVYGDGASVTDIECVMDYPEKYQAGYKSYTESLKGTLTIDGSQYEVLYGCLDGSLKDSIHTEDICMTLADSLPLDKSCIVEVAYPQLDSYLDYGKTLKFDYRIKSLDDVVTFGEPHENPIRMFIYTTEDIEDLSEAEIRSVPEIQKMMTSTSYSEITIISLKDAEALEDLKERLRINLSAIRQLGYESMEKKYVTAFFDEFHMKSAVVMESFYLEEETDNREDLIITKISDK